MSLTFPIPNFGLGAAPLGATSTNDPFAAASEAAAVEVVKHCVANGVTLIDTAPLYGAGVSEARVGLALREIPRDKVVISTKIGVLVQPDGSIRRGYSRDDVLRSIDDSLKRLGISQIDIAHIHDPENHYREALDEAFPALADLKAQGVIRAIGSGMNTYNMLADFARNAAFDCFLLAGRYTLLEQGPLNDFLPLCIEKKIGILLGGSLNTGILATGAVPGARYQYAEAPPEIMEKTRRIEAVCVRHGVALKTAAFQFALAHPAITALVVGMKTNAEVDDNLAALRAPTPRAFWDEIVAEKLVAEGAPVPY